MAQIIQLGLSAPSCVAQILQLDSGVLLYGKGSYYLFMAEDNLLLDRLGS